MAVYYGRNRSATYTLGSRLGRGGEGEVYEIAGRPNLVAKLYFDSKFSSAPGSPDLRQEQREKIETMLDQPVDPYINGVLSVAWPQDILIDQQGKFVGFTMPRVNSKHHIFAASRERERVKLYPNYTWKTAILIAYNLTVAVKIVHQTNAVVGDLNPNNIMIDERGHVTLIDTDSFNITNKRTGKVYKCTVGVPEMLPPELQGKDLSKPGSVFTKQTDSFALAIHIFNLLMNNCHPFGCLNHNKSRSSSSNNPIVSNIVKGICPYVTSATGSTSPDAPDVMMLPKEVRQLFDRSFSYTTSTSVKSSTIANRPSPEEWQTVLGALYSSSMKECRNAMPNLHMYPSHYSKCPWCEIRHVSPNPPPPPPPPPPPAIRRESWPLYLTCIIAGLVSSPFLAEILVPFCYSSLEFSLSYDTAYVILAIIGGIAGAFVAFLGQESYQTAYNAWPWLLLGLLVPVVTSIAVAILILGIIIVVAVVYIVVYILGIILALACVCGMCSGG